MMAAFVNVQANGGGTDDHWEGELETEVKEILTYTHTVSQQPNDSNITMNNNSKKKINNIRKR